MAANRVHYCDGVDFVSDFPRHWLEYTVDDLGNALPGPYRVLLEPVLERWLTVPNEGERLRRAFHVYRVHFGEEQEEAGCPPVARAAPP